MQKTSKSSETSYWRDMNAKYPHLKITSMLSQATKIGDRRKVQAFNQPLERTCCADNRISTVVCRSVCYVSRMVECWGNNVVRRAERNWEIVRRPDFAALAIGAIHASKVEFFRVHVAGDFFSREYINAWVCIAGHCPDVRFWTYTRAWRVIEFRPSLARLAALDNFRLSLSWDRETGTPPFIKRTRTAWLAANDEQIPPAQSSVAFRASPKRKSRPLAILGTTPVCPNHRGISSERTTCIECRRCLPTL